MLRVLNIFLLIVVGAMIVLLYQLKYESRLLGARAVKLTHNIEDERDTISVLKAEWSLLIQPVRVERLAKQHLGFKPVKPEQFVRIDWLAKARKINRQAGLNKTDKGTSSR